MGKSYRHVSSIMGQKVTLITTVKNEEGNIDGFFESILKQTRKPDEIVIVDGGSDDNTLLKLNRLNAVVIRKKGNRSIGRNIAIKVAKNSIIAVTDVGCVLDKYWLERLIKPFEKEDVDVVSGFYKAYTNGPFEECLASYTCTMSDKLNTKTFLPSSRSVAFRKKAWDKVRGYPEKLNTCEDLVFDLKLKQANFTFVMVQNAIVYWPQRTNIVQAAKQFFSYAQGDGQARYFRWTTPFLFARYILGVFVFFCAFILESYLLFAVLFLAFVGYLVWAVYKNARYVRNWKKFIYLPLLQLVSDVTVIVGTTLGYITSLRRG